MVLLVACPSTDPVVDDDDPADDDDATNVTDDDDAGDDDDSAAAVTTTWTFVADPSPLANPERGLYRSVDLVTERDLSWVADEGKRLAFASVRLDAWRGADLPQSLLDDLGLGIDAARAAGLKLVLRFAYNAGPWPNTEPDASKERILGHIAQLGPVFASHSDVIFVVQAGFIGAWGEWHSSTEGLLDDPQDRYDILDALLAALPAERMTQLRTPMLKDAGYGLLDAASAFSGAPVARIGHHNDCFLADATDQGTFAADDPEAWRDRVAAEGLFTPVGGETCAPSTFSGCANALAELERQRWTFLNHGWHPDVIQGWMDDGCWAEIGDRLGHRLELVDGSVVAGVDAVTITLRVRNTGFAPVLVGRPLVLLIDGAAVAPVATDNADARQWTPGGLHSVQLELPGQSSGEHAFGLVLPDPAPGLNADSRYAIRFANVGVWSDGVHELGTFVAP